MILQELKLVGIEGVFPGGSTRPLLIRAENPENRISPYILKLYKTDNIKQNFTVAKEIIVSKLANSFDLPVPEFGIINFDHKYLTDFYDNERISKIDLGHKFCSNFKSGYVIFNPLVSNSFLKPYHLENVFAFDNIILNTDRGGYRNKPNLLVSDEDFLLIDHELTLPFIDNHSRGKEIDYKNKFNSYNHTKHIFYNNLKKIKNKSELFDEFHECLKSLNINDFHSILDDFQSFNIEFGEKNTIFGYLNWIKNNRDYICKKLKERIL